MSSLGFTSKEQRNLGLLVHLMTSNPKILYAPAGSEADRVILKVRESGTLGAFCLLLGQKLKELGRGPQGPLCRLRSAELSWEGLQSLSSDLAGGQGLED